jgi:hypothetical protein
MTLVVRFSLILILIGAGLIVTVRLAAQTQALPAAILFTNPDGTPCDRPCLFGVRPGHTSHIDALALLNTHPLMTGIAIALVYNIGEPITHLAPTVALTLDREDRVTCVQLAMFGKPTVLADIESLGHVIDLLGTPELVAKIGAQTFSYYSNHQVIFAHYRTHLGLMTVDEPLQWLLVYASPPEPSSSGRPWQGFQTVSR